tara:strand:- start:46 stop:336 length:291 start_codon:yes stop_codon:yes gene_type:complete
MLHEAIRELYDTAVLIQGNTVNDVVVKDENGNEVSIVKDDVTAKITELEDATSYIHARHNAYPSIADQLDDMFHNGFDAWKATIQEVKDNHPKPSE